MTSIEISRTAISGPTPRPTTQTSVTDLEAIDSVVAAFNSLNGATAHTTLPCGSPVGIVNAYAVTFHWPGHTLAVGSGQSLCAIGRHLVLNGTKLHQALEDDEALVVALQAAIDAA